MKFWKASLYLYVLIYKLSIIVAFKMKIVDLSYIRVMLIGPSGAGKTSLFHCLKGLPKPENADSTDFADTHHVKQQWAKMNPSGEWVDVTESDMLKELAQLSNTGHKVKSKFQVSDFAMGHWYRCTALRYTW